MFSPASRPRLRPVESIVVPDARYGRVLVLRDTQGVTEAQAVLPPALVSIVGRFTGERTCEAIACEASAELRATVPVEVVMSLADQLDRGLFLDSPTFHTARADVERAFREATVRSTSHAGGAYHEDAAALRAYVERKCIGVATAFAAKGGVASTGKKMVALIAPHIDPWRGAVGYGHAYGTLADTLGPEADTFVLLGTSHAPMRQPFALCRKAFDTPLGPMEADLRAIDALAESARFDPYADELNHKREHSLEFQVVFLKHVLGARPARIVPILASLGKHQAGGTDPASDAEAVEFLDAVRSLVEDGAGRVVLVAGADLAHVGPRFGDPRPFDPEQRRALEATDRASLDRALAGDRASFWSHVARDLDARRVCGLAPIYSLLHALPPSAHGDLLHYEQTIDPQEGSIVSHAAVAFYARDL